MKFLIKTLGCKVNQYESEVIAQQLQSMGWEMITPQTTSAGPDAVIINTCTVTQKAAMQSRQATRQAIRAYPSARIVVTGCHAQIHQDEISRIQGVDTIVGQDRKHTIPALLSGQAATVLGEARYTATRGPAVQAFDPLTPALLGVRTRPFLKIQDGCNAFCTYCIVPYTRGRSRSMPPDRVIKHITRIAQAGYQEVVLTGIHLGCYGLDLAPQVTLLDLLNRIHTTQAIARVRLSSIEPHELSDDILQLVARSDARPGQICNHFHIPLQSGDDRILQNMHRPYRRNDFIGLINRIQQAVPEAGIGVDVLVGFPGETASAFANTHDLIEQLPLTYLHVFPFSSRPGTVAARLPDPVPAEVIKQRCRILRQLGFQKKQAFYRQQLGKTVEILIEERRERTAARLKGLTANYIPVLLDAEAAWQNSFAQVTLDGMQGEFLIGSIAA